VGIVRRNWPALAIALLYAASLGLWVVASKPVQFYYHYFLPSCFLVAALALALDAAWQAGWRKLALGVIAASCALFAFFYPILSAAALSDPQDFLAWAWLESWR
jgi:dolichyl-phosphate-mannose--protein O-mannosyl transferase